MSGIRFCDQANVFKKKEQLRIITPLITRGVLFTDAFDTRCQVVCLLLERPGVVSLKLGKERFKKKEKRVMGRWKHACE